MDESEQNGTSAGVSQQPPAQFFLQMLREGRFFIQRCETSGKAVFYPRTLSPFGGGPLRWEEARGTGTVYSVTVVKRRPERGGDYNVALIDLDEGTRLMSTVVDIAPADIHIDMRVRARIERDDETPRLVFVPAGQTPKADEAA